MQVSRLGTRKKPRTVSRHPDICGPNAVDPTSSFLFIPSFRVCFPFRDRLDRPPRPFCETVDYNLRLSFLDRK